MCEFCKDIATTDDEYMKRRYAGGDFIFKDENGFGVLIDTGDKKSIIALSAVESWWNSD